MACKNTLERKKIDLSMIKPVKEVINLLLVKLQPILGDDLIGLYVGGSIANNSFDPETSDIEGLYSYNYNISKKLIKHCHTTA